MVKLRNEFVEQIRGDCHSSVSSSAFPNLFTALGAYIRYDPLKELPN